jgi:hypothetical protein
MKMNEIDRRINEVQDEIELALAKGRIPRKFRTTFDRKTCKTIIDCGKLAGRPLKFAIDLRVL